MDTRLYSSTLVHDSPTAPRGSSVNGQIVRLCLGVAMHIAPDDSTLDRRARRTQTALRDALLSLMAEKTWDAIEVAAISLLLRVCRRASNLSNYYLARKHCHAY